MKMFFSGLAFIMSGVTLLGIFFIPMMRDAGTLSLGWCVILALLLALLTYLLFQLSVALVDSPKKKAH